MIESLWQYDFLRNAFLAGLIVGFIAPVLGVYIVVRRLSLMADALSHIALSGIAVTVFLQTRVPFLYGLDPAYGGMAFAVLGALSIEKLRSLFRHFGELAIPIMMSAGIGIGIIFLSLADGFTPDLYGYLFGSVSAVSRSDLYLIFVATMLIFIFVLLFRKELFLLSFDETFAKVAGIPARAIHHLFMIAVSISIALSMQIVGILLVSSLMTLPVAASFRVAKSFQNALFLSAIFGEFAVIGGLVAAYYLDLRPGGTIVILEVLLLLLTELIQRISIRWRGGNGDEYQQSHSTVEG